MTDARTMDETMADVRRAYRLVWAHQRRVMDMIRAVIEVFPETKHYYWSCNKFANPPGRGGGDPTQCWTWDALPFYDMSILRIVESESGEPESHKPIPGRWMLEIRHEADDGWSKTGKKEPDAREFKDAAESTSTLSICLWRSDTATGDWLNTWDSGAEWPEDDGTVFTDTTVGLSGVIRSVDIARVTSIEDVRALASDLRTLGREKLGLDMPDLE